EMRSGTPFRSTYAQGLAPGPPSRPARKRSSPALCSYCLRQISHSDQVVGRRREAEHPSDTLDPLVPRFAHHANRLHPSEDLFDPLALLLAHGVAGVARRPTVDGTAAVRGILRHLWRHLALTQARDTILRVVGLVGSHRHPLLARDLPRHGER